jgi:hypothetical protein
MKLNNRFTGNGKAELRSDTLYHNHHIHFKLIILTVVLFFYLKEPTFCTEIIPDAVIQNSGAPDLSTEEKQEAYLQDLFKNTTHWKNASNMKKIGVILIALNTFTLWCVIYYNYH